MAIICAFIRIIICSMPPACQKCKWDLTRFMIRCICMDLHRAGLKADWEAASPHQWNYWQRLAAKTHGYFTPGNIISILGAVLTILGLYLIYYGHFKSGLIAVGMGRLADVADGYVAHATRTKSLVGETVDTSLDKVAIFAALIVFMALNVAWIWLLTLLLLQQLAAGSLGGYARLKHIEVHPSRLGKYAAAIQWLVFVGFITILALQPQPVYAAFLLNIALFITIFLGYWTTAGYFRQIYRIERHK